MYQDFINYFAKFHFTIYYEISLSYYQSFSINIVLNLLTRLIEYYPNQYYLSRAITIGNNYFSLTITLNSFYNPLFFSH